MTRAARFGCALLALTSLPLAAAEETRIALRHDPFKRPAKPAPSAPAPPPPWTPPLRAVLVDGAGSLVNVDGTLLRLGEEIDGYRLVKVEPRRAIFVRGGERHVLEMDRAERAP